MTSRAVIAIGEDNDHLLVAGGGESRSGWLGVADEGVVRLRIGIVLSIHVRIAPTVIADARAVVVRVGHQVRVIWIREGVRVEYDGRTDPDKRANPEVVIISLTIRLRGTSGLVVVGADDMGVEIAMAIATPDRTVPVWCSLQPIVDNPAGFVGVPEFVECKMAGRITAALVDTAVADVDDKSGFVELVLRKSDIIGQPRQIPGS